MNILVFGDFLLESVKVELVFNEILIDFTEKTMVFESAEPLNPADVDFFTKLGLFAH